MMLNICSLEKFVREPSQEEKITMSLLEDKIRWAVNMTSEAEETFDDLLDEHVRCQYRKVVNRSLSI